MKVAGLFSGIGGLELPFKKRGAETALLCDSWESSRAVLRARFKDVPIVEDVRDLKTLPSGVDVLTAGFPCTDLSQAGRTAGISGKESGLVGNVFRILKTNPVEWLILENVRNMLVLDKGEAMHLLTTKLEKLGFQWAYRLVDSRFSGVPQRRHRVLMVASRTGDPRTILFADNSKEPDNSKFSDKAFGFYWTEGLTGLGWAQDGVPPLKGGSSVGIPSPPAVWIPGNPEGMKIVTPSIEDAEALQGFDRGWTSPAAIDKKNGPRWKLVGNAVSVGVAEWLVGRLYEPGDPIAEGTVSRSVSKWPNAAYGRDGKVWSLEELSTWPVQRKYIHLLSLLTPKDLSPLSARATKGFLERTRRASLRFNFDFLRDLAHHADAMEAKGQKLEPLNRPVASSTSA